MVKSAFLSCCFLLLSYAVMAQQSVVGVIADSSDDSFMIGVNLLLTNTADSTDRYFATTEIDGSFKFSKVKPGNFVLEGSYVGYKYLKKTFKVAKEEVDLRKLFMEQDAELLEELKVLGKTPIAVQIGDTTQYNANAFKTNPDASAEDLIKKMPGITVENGTVKAQGEDVRKVLVDGKPFFGDDPMNSLKNLPAEIIDKVQVLDQLSEQSQFTGFDDGNRAKTINIVTKPNSRKGKFGRLSGSYGPQNRYGFGGNLNLFNGDRRVSILGNFNNVSQLNFASEDLIGASGGSGRGRRGGGSSSFLVGQQNGLTTTQSTGLNFTDTWGKKVEVAGSYFFNHTNNKNNTLLNREYFIAADSSQFYREENSTDRDNFNHRFDLKVDYEIDSFNSVTVRPRLSLQNSSNESWVDGRTSLANGGLLNSMKNNQNAENSAFNFSNDILYRHRFNKAGRTISLNLNTELGKRDGQSYLDALNNYYTGESDRTDLIDQETNTYNDGSSVAANLVYTEPMGKRNQLMLEYRIAYDESNSGKEVYDLKEEGTQEMLIDSTLSNTFENTYLTNRAGVGYSLRGEKSRIRIGVNYQSAQLVGTQLFPFYEETNKHFDNVLPSFMYTYEFSKQKNIRMFYRTSTNAPSISQLQNVIDNTNPLQLRTGNPDLKQRYSHSFMTRYSSSNPEKSNNTFVLLNGSYTTDYISNATFLASKDSLLADGIVLYRGSRLTKPVNIGASRSLRSYVSYGTPIAVLKSNLNLGTGINYSQTPGLINNSENTSASWQFSQTAVLSSNISENLDFTLSSSANFTIVNNTLQPDLNNNYFSQTNNVRLKWIFWKGLTIESNFNHSLYAGLGDDFDRSVFLLNLGIGKRLFRGQRGEIKLSVFDLLNQNDNIGRTVNETYLEDRKTQSIQRYAMLTFSYNLRQFQGSKP